MQPANRHRRPEFVGCYDTESEACEVGYRSPAGRRFPVKAVLEKDSVISIPGRFRLISSDRDGYSVLAGDIGSGGPVSLGLVNASPERSAELRFQLTSDLKNRQQEEPCQKTLN